MFDEFLESATMAVADLIIAAQKSQREGRWPVVIELVADEQIFIAVESYKEAREVYFLRQDAEGQEELFTDIGRMLWCRTGLKGYEYDYLLGIEEYSKPFPSGSL